MHICLVNLPRFEIHRPPLSLAILSTICDVEQVSYNCIDLSLRIWQDLPNDFVDIDNFCITERIESTVESRLKEFINNIVKEQIQQHPDTVFSLSLLSIWSRPVAKMFCEIVRQHSQCEIVLGGQGLTDSEWTDMMLKEKLIDNFIVGEGEITYRKFLQGTRTGPGINNYNFEQIDDLDSYCVTPNYSKLPIQQYPYLNNRPELYINGSRGCVRNCGYCDIGHQWKKYRYRSAGKVAEEMIAQYQRHGITDFFFTDSLINGNMKMLEELCDILIAYKQNNPTADFKWRGQYIFRPRSTVKELHIKRLAEAGVDFLIIGLETGSDRVRHDMNKKHTTDDAEWYLEMFKKYGIQCRLLMITGWVTETLDDHHDTLRLFSRWQRFVASGTISGIELGSTLMILDHAPVGYQVDQLQIKIVNNDGWLWESALNPDLTIVERVRRRIETHREAIKYKWPITRSQYRLSTIKRNLEKAIDYFTNETSANKKIVRLVEIKKQAP
jgi:anaerobic magnesium-protoporphyrin IX monomethyl ester cyclase